MSVPIRGITLLHPWAFAIWKLGKDVENRTQHLTRKGGHMGMYLAIHGGVPPKQGDNQKWRDYMADLRALRPIVESDAAIHERFFQVVQLTDNGPQQLTFDAQQLIVPGIVAVARVSKCVWEHPSPWTARGQWQYLLEDVLLLDEPVPHVGSQGLWAIEPVALTQLIRAWEAAHDGACPFRSKDWVPVEGVA